MIRRRPAPFATSVAAPAGSDHSIAVPDDVASARSARGLVDRLVRVGPGVGRWLLGCLVLACAYYGAARVGYALDFSGSVATIVWLPVGVAIAFVYIGGWSLVPGVLIGDLLANEYSRLPLGAILGQATANVVEVVCVVLILRRLTRGAFPLASLRGLASMVAAILAGTLLSATLGSLNLLAFDVIRAEEWFKVWRTWWLGDASGALLVVPLILAWWQPTSRAVVRGRAFEICLLVCATAGIAVVVARSEEPLLYITGPLLVWAALRFGERGATAVIAAVAAAAVWNTTHYNGALHYGSINHRLLSVQLFIAVSCLFTLALAALVSERDTIATRLTASRIDGLRAADAARHQLERDLHDGAQQRLVALGMRLGLAQSQLPDEPLAARVVVEQAQDDLQGAVSELRDLARGVHPHVLTSLGLADALRSVAARSPIPVRLTALPAARVDDDAEAAAYFVAAEGVANAYKHACASRIDLAAHAGPSMLRVVVSDNGVGGATERDGSGLAGLRARVETLGGQLRLDSVAGRGTRIQAEIPIRE